MTADGFTMSNEDTELEKLRRENDELRRRIDDRHRVDTLRRALRGAESIPDVGARGVAYAAAELSDAPAILLYEEIARPGFGYRASEGLRHELADLRSIYVDRAPTLTAALADGAVVHAPDAPVSALVPLAEALEEPRLVAAGVYEGQNLVGLLVAAGGESLREWLSIAAGELSFAIAVTVQTQARTEELALRESQELQMASLLDDIEKRDTAFQEELHQARRFQQQLVALPPLRGVKRHSFYEPMGLIGGDLYAVSQVGNRIRVFIADATGHGIRASLTTMFIKSGYESYRGLEDPSLVLEGLNDSIAATYRSSEMLFTASCVDIHIDTGEVALACAGHPPACVIRGGEMSLLEGDGAPMGVRTGMKYHKVTTTLAKGDGIYLYTDGINEAHAGGGSYFGEERLYELIRKAHVDGDDVAARVRDELFDFAGPFLLSDDASLIGFVLE